MKSYTSLENVNNENQYFSLAIGNFDGVHVGHKQLLNETVKDAQLNSGVSGVFTFWPHPLKTLKQGIPFKLLSNLKRKQELLQQCGIDKALFMPFTKEIMELTPEEFVSKILVDKLNVASIHVGYNFSFGKNASGTTLDLIKFGDKYGFKVSILNEVILDEQSVSSTLIRQCLEDGEIHEANKFLGYNYKIKGEVVSGDQRGRLIGFPTANVQVDEELIIPARGVYAAYVKAGNNIYKSVLNIGNKPTFGINEVMTIEAHLLDYKGDLYGTNIEVEFIKRLRGEKKFSSVDELIEEINKDIDRALQIL